MWNCNQHRETYEWEQQKVRDLGLLHSQQYPVADREDERIWREGKETFYVCEVYKLLEETRVQM